jgi:hypothetical protein
MEVSFSVILLEGKNKEERVRSKKENDEYGIN